MLYDIGMTIAYDYDRPAVAGRHILRLMPADIPGLQRRITGSLSIRPEPAEQRPFVDFFGNPGLEVVYRAAHDEILFRVASRIERLPEPPGLDISPPLSRLPGEIASHRSLDAQAPHHFLSGSPHIALSAAITAWTRGQVAPAMTVAAAVEAVGLAIHREFEFDAEATTVDTPPAEAFARRRGVCQDFAQIMIAGLRGIGIPAGYVSGFLRTFPPPGQARLEGADAMHAWVRAWCGRQAGWIEYDPTNAMHSGTDHIVVARGRDYGDVSPVKGVLRIAGEQSTEQAVDVVPVVVG